MRTFSKSTLRRFWERGYADAEAPLTEWYDKTTDASWKSSNDIRSTFGGADLVGDKAIFNIGGNKYRLIAQINFQWHGVLVKWLGTHAEYQKLTEEDIEKL